MSSNIQVKKRGQRMRPGKGWRMINIKTGAMFVGAVLAVTHVNGARVAVVSVWNGRK